MAENKTTAADWAKALYPNVDQAQAVLSSEQQAQVRRDIEAMEKRLSNQSPNEHETWKSASPLDRAIEQRPVPIPGINVDGPKKENSGLRVNYYLANVTHPQREDQAPYQAECEDIIDALGMTFDEANIFKEIWRTANERTHGKGKEGNSFLRAAQKIVHYGNRILKRAQRSESTY